LIEEIEQNKIITSIISYIPDITLTKHNINPSARFTRAQIIKTIYQRFAISFTGATGLSIF
jgi:hypothetical protein